jgi:hypothetical protein
MKHIAAKIRSNLVVEVDDGDRTDTNSSVSKYFQDRQRKVHTIDGDLIFTRGEWGLDRDGDPQIWRVTGGSTSGVGFQIASSY